MAKDTQQLKSNDNPPSRSKPDDLKQLETRIIQRQNLTLALLIVIISVLWYHFSGAGGFAGRKIQNDDRQETCSASEILNLKPKKPVAWVTGQNVSKVIPNYCANSWHCQLEGQHRCTISERL